MIKFDLIKNFYKLIFKLKYANSRFGIAWSFISPFISLCIFTLVFKYILKIQTENFALYLYSGLVIWNFVSSNINNSCFTFVKNYQIIQKIKFDYKPLLIAEILVNSTIFFINILILSIFAYISGVIPNVFSTLVYLPLIYIHLFILSFSLGLIIATLTVFFRDIPHLTEIIINIWFYSSPVFYIPDMIPRSIRTFFYFNPVYFALMSARKLFYNNGIFENISYVFLINTITLLILTMISIFLYKKLEKWFPEYV